MKIRLKKSILSILPLATVLIFDFFTKHMATQLTAPIEIGIIKIQLVFNHGMMMGSFSDLSVNAKSSILFTLGSFIFAAYVFSLWLIPIRSKATVVGLSLLVGGIYGNIIDRFDDQRVVDFLSLNFGNHPFPFMNMADLFQLLGYGLIIVGVWRDSLYYWPKNDWRFKYLINHKFQIGWSLLISSLTFFTSVISLIFAYSFLKSDQSEITLRSYQVIGISISLCLSLITFFMSLVITHRVAGPVYAVQRQMKFMLKGEFKQFKLRNNDEFKELERTVNLLQEEYHILHEISHDKRPDNIVNLKSKSKNKAA